MIGPQIEYWTWAEEGNKKVEHYRCGGSLPSIHPPPNSAGALNKKLDFSPLINNSLQVVQFLFRINTKPDSL
jgi:hypothetical protein